MSKSLLKRIFVVVWIAHILAILIPDKAAAHLVTTGMGPVYDGIGHLLLTPEDLVPTLAVALYAGMRGKAPGKYALFVLPLAWMAGGLAGLALGSNLTFSLSAISFLLLGALIAADIRMSTNIFTILVMAVGVIHGFFNGVAMKGGPGISGLLGIMATLFILIALVSAFVVSLRAAWTRIAVRVAGSWITAIGLLMLGWMVKGAG